VEESQRGNLFLKRAFWLARRYVEGDLPDAAVPFPAASTVFLADPPGDLPLPRIARSDLEASGVSGEVERSPIALPSQLEWRAETGHKADRRHEKKAPPRITLTLPELHQPPRHGSLKLRYRSDTAATLSSEIFDVRGQRDYAGKRIAIEATGDAEAEMELPLPDFESLRITLNAELDDPRGRLRLSEAWLESDLLDEDAHIRVLTRSANAVEVEVSDLPGPRILTFLDSQYPGWRAWVDGSAAEILVANEAFKAVVLAPGTHRVRFEFRPPSLRWGATLSLLSLALASAYLLFWDRLFRDRMGSGA
jgi:hypothetical protein